MDKEKYHAVIKYFYIKGLTLTDIKTEVESMSTLGDYIHIFNSEEIKHSLIQAAELKHMNIQVIQKVLQLMKILKSP